MTITETCAIAVGWPGAFGWAAFCFMILGIAWAIAYVEARRPTK